jgi:hypothetical protein
MEAEEDLVMQSRFHNTIVKNVTGELSSQQAQLRHTVEIATALMKGMSKLANAALSPTHVQLLAYNALMDVTNLLHYHLDTIAGIVSDLGEQKFSQDLMHTDELARVLHQVQQNLPDKMHLALKADQIGEYYRLPLAGHLTSTTSIRAVLNIPLAEYGQWFHIYEVIPFPHTVAGEEGVAPTKEAKRIRWVGPPTTVAISTDAERFIDLGSWPRVSCIGDKPLICGDLHAVAIPNEENCLFYLMTKRYKEEPLMRCLYEGMTSPKTIVQSIDDEFWALSVAKPVRITSQCIVPGKPKEPLMVKPDLMLAGGEATLFIPRHCKASFDGLQIPLRLQVKDAWRKKTINLTEIARLRANVRETAELDKDALALGELFRMGQAEIIGLQGEETRGDESLKKLQRYLEIPRNPTIDLRGMEKHHTTLYSLTSVILIMALAGTGYIIWHRKRMLRQSLYRNTTVVVAPPIPTLRAPLYSARTDL